MLATSSLTALLRLSSAVFSFAVLSTPGNAAALDSVSSQTDDSIAGIIREIHSRLPIILDNQHYQLNRTRIWEYIDRGGNPNITFPDRVGVGAHDWSLLSACVARNDVETINMLRARGADINYQNDLGVTPLHWAAYYGHLAAVEALLSPINGIANSMLFDNYGLLPGD